MTCKFPNILGLAFQSMYMQLLLPRMPFLPLSAWQTSTHSLKPKLNVLFVKIYSYLQEELFYPSFGLPRHLEPFSISILHYNFNNTCTSLPLPLDWKLLSGRNGSSTHLCTPRSKACQSMLKEQVNK